jgi:hypothetical protein
MSDLSEVQSIVNAAYDCKIGATFEAHAVCTSSAISRLKETRKTPRKTPGVATSARRGYIATDRALVGGNFIARDMLGHLRYWLEPDTNGKPRSTRMMDGFYWEVCSLTFWEKQLMCSRQEARTGVEKLLASGTVVCKMDAFGNWDTSHFRLVLPVTQIKLRAVIEEAKCVASNTVCVTSNIAMTEKLHPEVTKEKNKTYKAAVPAQAYQAEPKTKPIQAEPKPEPTPIEPKDFPDTFLIHYKRMEKTHDMENLLKVCIDGSFIQQGRAMLSDTECSILERIEIENTLNDSLEKLLTLLGTPEAWMVFTHLVTNEDPEASTPNLPNLAFLKKHFHLFLGTDKKEPQPVVVATVDEPECLGLDPDQSITPWTVEETRAWYAQQLAAKDAEAAVVMAMKSKKPASLFAGSYS